MVNFSKQSNKNPCGGGNHGASLVEVLVASAILLSSFVGSFKAMEGSRAVLKSVKSLSEAASLDSLTAGYLQTLIDKEAETDPCLKMHKLADQVSENLGPLGQNVSAVAYTNATIDTIKDFYQVTQLSADWNAVVGFCNSPSADSACVVFQPTDQPIGAPSGAASSFALAMLTQSVVDHKTGQAPSACENSKILDTTNIEAANTGIGIKANYVLVSGTKLNMGGIIAPNFRKASGAVYHSFSKKIRITETELNNRSADPTSNCSKVGDTAYRCLSLPIPPDPGTDLAGWKGFLKVDPTCDKCVGAQDYK